MQGLELLVVKISKAVWGMPLVVLLTGGGLFFLLYFKGYPFLRIGHSFKIIRGAYDRDDEKGHLTHFQALTTALSATIGLGNISGVAVAISAGGPGAVFWMWVSALVGVATKFVTCTLSVLYRSEDDDSVRGGPMYIITAGLGERFKPLAMLFAFSGMIGLAPLFQTNQLVKIVNSYTFYKFMPHELAGDALTGILVAIIVGLVVLGGIKRIGAVTSRLIPAMVLVYCASVIAILMIHASGVADAFTLIFSDAFSGSSVAGGVLGTVIITGIRRAAFSNEAGIGTAPMAHGSAKTRYPVREGLVASVGPIVDTLIICTMTALAIIVTGAYQSDGASGIMMTARAFEGALGGTGIVLLITCVFFFSISTLFAFPYYGTLCFAFIFGRKRQNVYAILFVVFIVVGAVTTLNAAVSIIDAMYALMALPTMTAALLLSPRVKEEVKKYDEEFFVKD